MALDPDEVRGLLDLSRKLDVGLLDAVVGNLHSGAGDQRRSAQEVLTSLRDLPEAWTKVRPPVGAPDWLDFSLCP